MFEICSSMTQWNVLSLRAFTMMVNVRLNKSKALPLFITYLQLDDGFEVVVDIYTTKLQIMIQSIL